MQITILNQSGNPGNQYPARNYWKHFSEMPRIIGVQQDDMSNVLRRVRDTSLCDRLKTTTWKEDGVLRLIKGNRFLSASRSRVDSTRVASSVGK